MPTPTSAQLRAEHARNKPTIKTGNTYTFRSTQVSDPYRARDRQHVLVLSGPADKDEPEQENLYQVRFPDGFVGDAFEGELDGWFELTEQTVEDWGAGA
jgi:hypothetical protein